MIAQASWFNRRKYGGWGLSPKTWQGYLYIVVLGAYVGVVQASPLNESLKMTLMIGFVGFVLVDVLHVMTKLKLDEREQKIEAVSERNASWTMVGSTVIAILYTVTLGKDLKGIELLPVLVFPIMTGVVAKGVSNFILERKGI